MCHLICFPEQYNSYKIVIVVFRVFIIGKEGYTILYILEFWPAPRAKFYSQDGWPFYRSLYNYFCNRSKKEAKEQYLQKSFV